MIYLPLASMLDLFITLASTLVGLVVVLVLIGLYNLMVAEREMRAGRQRAADNAANRRRL